MHSYLSTEHAEIISLAHEIAPTMPGRCWSEVCLESERLQAELSTYALAWDASADALLVAAYAPCLECPKPPMPAPQTAAQRKALYYQSQGVIPVRSVNGWLVPSATRKVVHFVDDVYRCSCEAGQADRGCWHAALVGLLDRKVAA